MSASPHVKPSDEGVQGGSVQLSQQQYIGIAVVVVIVLIYYFYSSSSERYRSSGYNASDAGANRFASSTSQVNGGGNHRVWTGTGPRPPGAEHMQGKPLVVSSHRKSHFLGGPAVKSDPQVGHSPENSEAQLRALLGH